jgi:hypothetical protein
VLQYDLKHKGLIMLPKKPSDLPPLLHRHVYLGKGTEFKIPINGDPSRFQGAFFMKGDAFWEKSNSMEGCYEYLHYSAPIDSEIVRLNGGANKRKKRAEITPISLPSVPDGQKYYGFLSSRKGFIVGVGYKSDKYRLVSPNLMSVGNGWSLNTPLVSWSEITLTLPSPLFYEFSTFRALTAWLNKVK